jgi:hypothetical protein
MKIHRLVPSGSLRTLVASRRLHLVRLCALPVAALAGSAYAQNHLHLIGGGGGGGFAAPCAATELLTGFELRTGDYVDALRPLCATATGPDQIGAASDSAWHGGAGGGHTRVVCPGDKPIVTGMFVGKDPDEGVVNNLLLYCNVAAGTKPSGDSTSAFARAGGDISASHDDVQGCPHGQVAVGVHGRSGRYLDAVGLICDASRLALPASDRPVVKSIGRVGIGSAAGHRRPICEAARDARARNSPAAANLEAQCLATRTTVTSIGRSGANTSSTAQLPRHICDSARDARARNSPAAPNLEAQCLAAGGPPAATPPPAAPSPAAPASSPTAPAPPPVSESADSQRRTSRDAAIAGLIGSVISGINESRRDAASRVSPRGSASTLPDDRIDAERDERRRDPYQRGSESATATRLEPRYGGIQKVEDSASDELRCRGGEGIRFSIVEGRTNSSGEATSYVAVYLNPAAQAAGAGGRSLQPGQCAFPDRALRADEPYEIFQEIVSFGQTRQQLHGTPIDTSPTAAERYPDAQNIQQYLSDPKHYWSFFVRQNAPLPFGRFEASAGRYWKPAPGIEDAVTQPVDHRRAGYRDRVWNPANPD